ncbi:MAG: sigma-70 family RNA polymerase sigma factor [Odoribacter sp.]|nr:sigma-70 family RNA polymerase sigma factor [Odoribacter sp.]
MNKAPLLGFTGTGQMNEQEEKTVVEQLRRRDEKAIETLFRHYHRPLIAYCMRYLASTEDAEDIVQTVFISFWEKWQGKTFTGSLSAYLYGAVGKAALKSIREAGKVFFTDIEGRSEDFLDEVMNDTAEAQEQLYQQVQSALEALPANQQRVVKELIFEGKPYKTIAAEMQVSVNTVKTHYIRALQSLRKAIDPKSYRFLLLAFFIPTK